MHVNIDHKADTITLDPPGGTIMHSGEYDSVYYCHTPCTTLPQEVLLYSKKTFCWHQRHSTFFELENWLWYHMVSARGVRNDHVCFSLYEKVNAYSAIHNGEMPWPLHHRYSNAFHTFSCLTGLFMFVRAFLLCVACHPAAT